MIFNKYVAISHYGNRVIVGNKENGKWIKISTEVYNYIKDAINLKLCEDAFINNFELDEDRKYIKEICNNMKLLGILTDDNSDCASNKIKKVTIELTNRCNLRCTHCCMDSNEYNEELSTMDMLTMLDKVIDWNPDKIVLSGGEPLIRTDIIDILEYLRERYKGYITFCTNGLLINEKNINILKKCTNQIDISIDGVDEKSCADIRGKGVFEKVIKNIKLLKKKGYNKISLSMVITDKNEALKNKFYRLNEELGTKPVTRGISLIGRGVKNREKLTGLPKGEVYISKDFYNIEDKQIFKFGGCKAGKTELFIRYNGEIYPCPLLIESNYKINDVKNINRIEDIFEKKIILLQNEFVQKCNVCEVKEFCWACPATINEYIKNNCIENYCEKVKKVYFDKVWGEEK